MRTALAITIALAAAASLAMAKPTPGATRQEHDPDTRAVCVTQLLTIDGDPLEAGYVIGTLNYTDRYYGGPCAALEHYMEHGWY